MFEVRTMMYRRRSSLIAPIKKIAEPRPVLVKERSFRVDEDKLDNLLINSVRDL